MNDERRRKGRVKPAMLRSFSALGVIVFACLGLAVHTGTGTPSAWGVADVAALCPLGAIEVLIASRTFVPPLLIGFAIVVVLTLLLGRVFCAWGCPVPLLRRVLGSKSSQERVAARSVWKSPEKSDSLSVSNGKRPDHHDGRIWTLGATLLATAAFGFPVFCLICPVGLTFATLAVVWRLFQFNETTWSLVVFPAMLLLELIVLRRWCHRFCPLGALLSLISRGNRTFRPQADVSTCLRTTGGEVCQRCVDACPEGIDVHDVEASTSRSECTKCRECAHVCPVQAIHFPFLPKP